MMSRVIADDPESLTRESAVVCDKDTFKSFLSKVVMSTNIMTPKGYDFII